MKFLIFDIETDGLLSELTKMHCLSYTMYDKDGASTIKSLTTKEEVKTLFNSLEDDVIISGHNIIRYDIPALMKLFGIIIKNKMIDSLALSYYLFPEEVKHGLEFWGSKLGTKKVEIKDWKNLSQEDYIHRCEIDVEINTDLFIFFLMKLFRIYDTREEVLSICSYLTFKMDCLREQEEIGIPLDVELVNQHLEVLQKEFDAKTKILSDAMPKDLGKILKTKPKNFFKKDGSLTSYATTWITFLEEHNCKGDEEEVREAPNPSSNSQLKNWLDRLGWKPITFKQSKATKEYVPQVSLPFGQGICPSVKELYEVEPALEELEGYYMAAHRIGLFKSFLKNEKNGKIQATAGGYTKTLRLKHSQPFVNLPKPGVYYGKEIREVLVIPNDDYLMCGSDVSGLEDNCKRHYLYYFDPEYVKEMETPDFDPHLDIGILAGLITKEEADFYKKVDTMSDEEKKTLSEEDLLKVKKIKKARSTAKTANFAATYGAGGPKIAETAKISLQEGEDLHKLYWERNWAILEAAKNFKTKTVGKETWIQNPISKFWLYLTEEKDKFSAVNQNTGKQ